LIFLIKKHMGKLFLFGILLLNLSGGQTVDTIVLTTGESLEGHLLSADEQVIRLRDGRGIVEEIPRANVVAIRLTSAPIPHQSVPALEQPANENLEQPEEQRQFCSLVAAFQKEQMAYAQEVNPIRKAGLRMPDPYRYEPQVRDLFGQKHEFTNWTGTLRFGALGRSVGIVFTPACTPPQMIQFGNATEQPGMAVQEGASTIIRPDSLIGRTLSAAKSAEQAAIVSGMLIPISGFMRFSQALNGQANSGYGRALFRSQLNPAGASVAQPNYLVKFTSVQLVEDKIKAAAPRAQ
jgi:hypothetical protein